MRISYLFLLPFLIFIVACGNPEAEKAKQKAKEDSLLQVQQDSLLDVFRGELESISAKVNEVSVRNGMLNFDATEGVVLSKEVIMKQVESLDQLLSKNQSELDDLYNRMRQSKVKNSELEKLIASMQSRISQREEQIDQLMAMLGDKDILIENIKLAVDSFRRNNISLTEDLIEMDEEMHVVRYVVGENKELKEKGIITKEGGILGIGGTKKLDASQLDPSFFTMVDQRELQELPLYSKKAKVITNHPETSYEWVLDSEGQVESLSIKDRERFWSVSDYLVIEVSN
ncbi:MAG: hypothetical protein RLP15_04370 [Cryomorphaceae bacterium]